MVLEPACLGAEGKPEAAERRVDLAVAPVRCTDIVWEYLSTSSAAEACSCFRYLMRLRSSVTTDPMAIGAEWFGWEKRRDAMNCIPSRGRSKQERRS